jgi:non-homologous end joining protein Ku
LIAAARGSRPKVIELEHFVAVEQIDPVFSDKPYLTDRGGEVEIPEIEPEPDPVPDLMAALEASLARTEVRA